MFCILLIPKKIYRYENKKEPAAFLPESTDKSASLTDSAIGISELLQLVNGCFSGVITITDLTDKAPHKNWPQDLRAKIKEVDIILFRKGMQNVRIKTVQYSAHILSFRVGRFDGYFDNNTEIAVRGIQRKYGITVTGEINDLTWSTLLGEIRSIQVELSNRDITIAQLMASVMRNC